MSSRKTTVATTDTATAQPKPGFRFGQDEDLEAAKKAWQEKKDSDLRMQEQFNNPDKFINRQQRDARKAARQTKKDTGAQLTQAEQDQEKKDEEEEKKEESGEQPAAGSTTTSGAGEGTASPTATTTSTTTSESTKRSSRY